MWKLFDRLNINDVVECVEEPKEVYLYDKKQTRKKFLREASKPLMNALQEFYSVSSHDEVRAIILRMQYTKYTVFRNIISLFEV